MDLVPPLYVNPHIGLIFTPVVFFAAADNGGSASGGTSGIPASNPTANSKSAARNLGSSAGEKEEGKKVRRQWESWSTEDKNTFFEGLYEVHVVENNQLRWLTFVCGYS